MNISQKKYLMLLSAMSEAIFRLQAVTQLMIVAQQEAEQMSHPKSDDSKDPKLDAAQKELQEAIKKLLSAGGEEIG